MTKVLVARGDIVDPSSGEILAEEGDLLYEHDMQGILSLVADFPQMWEVTEEEVRPTGERPLDSQLESVTERMLARLETV